MTLPADSDWARICSRLTVSLIPTSPSSRPTSLLE
jgi:hypothetical protein